MSRAIGDYPQARRPERRTRTQTVYLVRHAVAVHNAPGVDLRDPRYTDPALTVYGTRQAEEAGERVRSDAKGADDFAMTDTDGVQLVISSPLRRCLQSASLAFPGAARGLGPSIVCNELVREAYGMHFPDKRGKKSDAQAEFPWVSFPPDMSEIDSCWRPHERETPSDVVNRAVNFFEKCICRQSEDCIAVLSHGVWIELCLLHYCPEVLDMGKRRVYNCEAFRVHVVSGWDGGNITGVKLINAVLVKPQR